MIKANNGEVIIKGRTTEIASDLTMLIRGILKSFEKHEMEKEEAEMLVRKAVELAFKSEKEICNEVNKMMKDLMKDILKALEEEEEEEESNE